MSLLAKKTGEDFNFEICPAGNHIAVCFSVIDLGVQEVNFQGQISYKRKVRVSWEIPEEKMTEGEFAGQPFSISKNYTLSLHEKSVLYKDLISWRGKAFTEQELQGFDLFSILGAPCMVNVTHQPSQDNTKTYANVASVAQLPKGMVKPKSVSPFRKFDTEDFDQSEFEAMPQWLKDKINLPSPVISVAMPQSQHAQPDSFDDDIPF